MTNFKFNFEQRFKILYLFSVIGKRKSLTKKLDKLVDLMPSKEDDVRYCQSLNEVFIHLEESNFDFTGNIFRIGRRIQIVAETVGLVNPDKGREVKEMLKNLLKTINNKTNIELVELNNSTTELEIEIISILEAVN